MSRTLAALLAFAAAIAAMTSMASAGAGADGLHDIKGPLPPSDVPPLAMTAAIVAGAAGFTALRRKKPAPSSRRPADLEAITPQDRLIAMREAYRKGVVTERELFDSLSELIRRAVEADPALTADETVAFARERIPEQAVALLASELALCDSVRYGKGGTDGDAVYKALDHAAELLSMLTEIKT